MINSTVVRPYPIDPKQQSLLVTTTISWKKEFESSRFKILVRYNSQMTMNQSHEGKNLIAVLLKPKQRGQEFTRILFKKLHNPLITECLVEIRTICTLEDECSPVNMFVTWAFSWHVCHCSHPYWALWALKKDLYIG